MKLSCARDSFMTLRRNKSLHKGDWLMWNDMMRMVWMTLLMMILEIRKIFLHGVNVRREAFGWVSVRHNLWVVM